MGGRKRAYCACHLTMVSTISTVHSHNDSADDSHREFLTMIGDIRLTVISIFRMTIPDALLRFAILFPVFAFPSVLFLSGEDPGEDQGYHEGDGDGVAAEDLLDQGGGVLENVRDLGEADPHGQG